MKSSLLPRLLLWTSSLALAALFMGCGAKVESLEASPSEVKITSADQKPQVQVTAKDKDGNAIQPVPVLTWKSGDEAVAGVGPDGTVTAKATGDAELTVSEPSGKSASVKVMVSFPSQLAISGNPPQLAVGATQKVTAEVKDEKGRMVEGQAVTWSSADAALATIGEDGTVTAVAAGKVKIEAKSGNLTAGFELEIIAAPPAVPVP